MMFVTNKFKVVQVILDPEMHHRLRVVAAEQNLSMAKFSYNSVLKSILEAETKKSISEDTDSCNSDNTST